MRILQIIAGNLTGGAARGAYWLHCALRGLGVYSKILTNSEITFGDKNITTTLTSKKEKIKNMFRCELDILAKRVYKNVDNTIFSTGTFGFDFTRTGVYKKSDIIHLHWICGGLVNIKHLAKIDKPIIWTMRDMWPFTGGCHYAMECENYKTGCGHCRQLNSRMKYDLSRFILNRKLKYLPKNMKIVGISHWLSKRAKESFLFKDFDVRTIYNNVDTNEFFRIDKKIAREILGISTEKTVILTVAQFLGDFYKGFDKFIEAVKSLNRSKYYLCFVGDLDRSLAESLGFEYKDIGYLYDNVSLRLVYSAADVFVAPSLMDAFGKTLAESMACGTPVACFDAAGPKEIVDHTVNGYKAKPFDASDLAYGIEWIIENPEYEELSKNAREKVAREFDSKIIAKKYIELYKEVLENKKK